MAFLFGASSAMLIVAAPFIGCFGANAVRCSLEGKGFLVGRSCCDACGRHLGIRDLVPILSWLLQRGRCRTCSAPVLRLYPSLEAGFLLIALWAVYAQPDLLLSSLLLGWALLILLAFDVLAFIMPNVLTISLGAGGLLLAASQGNEALCDSAIGLIAGGAALLLVRLLYKHLRGREGLGLGDVKLFAAAGAWVKLEGLPSVLLIGAALALLYALFVFRRSFVAAAQRKVPLGAGLCAGLWLTWLYGPLFDWSFDAILRGGASA